MVKVQRLFAKTNLKIQVCRTDKIPLGTKRRTSFPVSRRKLLDRACFVTSFRQGGYTPLRRLCVYPLWTCCSPPASLEKQIPKIRPFGHKKIPLKQFGYLPCLL
uniref:hypothetical protein n=1 Tax=Dialister sp. TaxID=1955814 RepID=UPI004028E286